MTKGSAQRSQGSSRPRPVRALAGIVLRVAGGLFVIQMLLGLLGLPRMLTRWLAGGEPPPQVGTRYVVVLGGGGIPSESGLIRCYCAADYATGRTGITCIVSLPCDIDPSRGSVGRMRDELVMRGVHPETVRMEYRGRDTHEQAVNIRDMLGTGALASPVIVVTSPTHVRRSLLCFRKAGFRNVQGLSAGNTGVEADTGTHTAWRYGFWNNLVTQVHVLRELVALGLYRLRGWI